MSMFARIALRAALALLTILAVPIWVLAEETPSVDSPEAFQAACDQAMPDLLQGKLPGIFEKIAPKGTVEELSRELRRGFEPYRSIYGTATDAIYIGTIKRGTMLRQFVYLCRYEHTPIVWRFTASEYKGRWLLTGGQFQPNFAGLLEQAPADAPEKDAGYAQLADKFVGALVHGRSEAFDTLKANLLQHDDMTLERARREAEEIAMRIVLDGGSTKFEAIESKNIGGILAGRCYLVACERGRTAINVMLYRPGKDWKILGFFYRPVNGGDEMLAGAPLEPPSSAAASQTARKPDAEAASHGKPKLR
jgi:hypothetical protein